MRIFSLAAVLFAVASVGVVGQAQAYSYNTCLGEKLKWDSNSVTLNASATSFPAGEWRDTIQSSVTRFNVNPSKFRYNLAIDSGSVGRNNGQNETWGSSDAGILSGAPAIAYTWWTCYWFFGDHVSMDEVDVIFDYRAPWMWASSEAKSGLIGYGGSGRPMRTTAIHEFGHGLKLNHVNTEYNVMGTDFQHLHANGSTTRAYLGEDAADGAVFLYGATSSAHEDLGVTHWKYSGASGEYSSHAKTQLFNTSGGVLSNFNDGGETRYRVTKGQQVQAEFTYENNGKSTQSNVKIGFFISTNDTISTGDQRIGGVVFNLARGDVLTTRTTLTIPSSLNSGQNYWLGVVIDEDGSISEVTESNNATYIPIRIQ